jgi:hypothetical protein
MVMTSLRSIMQIREMKRLGTDEQMHFGEGLPPHFERASSFYRFVPKLVILAVAASLMLLRYSLVLAQTPASALAQEEQLEREFTDPLTTMPQVVIRDSYTPANYGPCTQFACVRNYETNQSIIRPLIPRIPPNTLLPIPQLVRPTFALVTVPSSRGGTRTEFGDLPMFDAAILPWPNRQKTGLLLAVGPTFVFPTATSKSAGQGAWQAGPALGMIYSRIPGLLIGFIAQNPIAFAYTSPHRPPQNTFELQPVIALHLWRKWYLRSAEAEWSMGWHHHSPTMLPLSLAIGRTLVHPGLPPMSLFVGGQWMAYRQFAPIAPQTTVNFGMTVAFPRLRDILYP